MRSLVALFLRCPDFCALLPVAVEAIKNLAIGAVSGRGLVDYHYVQACQLRLLEPKGLSDDAFNPVSVGGRATVLF